MHVTKYDKKQNFIYSTRIDCALCNLYIFMCYHIINAKKNSYRKYFPDVLTMLFEYP